MASGGINHLSSLQASRIKTTVGAYCTYYLCNKDPIISMNQSVRSAPRWRRIVFALTRKWGAEVCPGCQGITLKSKQVPNGIFHEVYLFVRMYNSLPMYP